VRAAARLWASLPFRSDSETVRSGAEAPSLGVEITGVMYRGVCIACNVDEAWSNAKLLKLLDAREITHESYKAP
jgi:hypothetical protein